MLIIMLQIAVCGKPNVGKSSFFNSATASGVEMANYPFTCNQGLSMSGIRRYMQSSQFNMH